MWFFKPLAGFEEQAVGTFAFRDRDCCKHPVKEGMKVPLCEVKENVGKMFEIFEEFTT